MPAETKQKKLILPSVHLPRHRDSMNSRPSSRNSRRSGSLPRKKGDDKNQVDPESLNIPNARILCSTSPLALRNFTEEELREHVKKLEETTALAGEVLTYWLERRNSAVGDKEAFEMVVHNLVKHAKAQRQGN